jgi:hypothetical protein
MFAVRSLSYLAHTYLDVQTRMMRTGSWGADLLATSTHDALLVFSWRIEMGDFGFVYINNPRLTFNY